jgi:GxxExxY protein
MNENEIGDVVVETAIHLHSKVILELKSVEKLSAAHKKQLLTYLKLGYLLNFGEALMKDGFTRVINGQLWKLRAPVSP